MIALRAVACPATRVAARCFAAQAAAAEVAPPAAKKKKRVRRELPAALKLTEGAATRIREMLEDKEGAIGVRLGVRTRTCSRDAKWQSGARPRASTPLNNSRSRFASPSPVLHTDRPHALMR